VNDAVGVVPRDRIKKRGEKDENKSRDESGTEEGAPNGGASSTGRKEEVNGGTGGKLIRNSIPNERNKRRRQSKGTFRAERVQRNQGDKGSRQSHEQGKACTNKGMKKREKKKQLAHR